MVFLRRRRFWTRQLLHLFDWAGNFRKHMDDGVTDKGLLAFQILTSRKLSLKLEKQLVGSNCRELGSLQHPCFSNTDFHSQPFNQWLCSTTSHLWGLCLTRVFNFCLSVQDLGWNSVRSTFVSQMCLLIYESQGQSQDVFQSRKHANSHLHCFSSLHWSLHWTKTRSFPTLASRHK